MYKNKLKISSYLRSDQNVIFNLFWIWINGCSYIINVDVLQKRIVFENAEDSS